LRPNISLSTSVNVLPFRLKNQFFRPTQNKQRNVTLITFFKFYTRDIFMKNTEMCTFSVTEVCGAVIHNMKTRFNLCTSLCSDFSLIKLNFIHKILYGPGISACHHIFLTLNSITSPNTQK
jgi:hypothetical protein